MAEASWKLGFTKNYLFRWREFFYTLKADAFNKNTRTRIKKHEKVTLLKKQSG